MGFLQQPGIPLVRQETAAYATPPASGVFASEDWEARTNGSNPDGTNFQVGAGTWYNNFGTVVSTDQSDGGTRSLKFPFDTFGGVVRELWYDLNVNKTDIWVRYQIFIPTDYAIVDSDPTSSLAFGGGDKEWVLFSDGYSTNYPTLILGRYFQRREFDGGPLITPPTKIFQLGNMSATDQSGTRVYDTIPHVVPDAVECLFDITVDLGTWQTRTLHLKMPTNATSDDGVIEYWNTKANGVTYKLVDVHDGSWYGANPNSTGGNYMNGGYMLGSSNSGFVTNPTNFFIDKVQFSNTNDWGVS